MLKGRLPFFVPSTDHEAPDIVHADGNGEAALACRVFSFTESVTLQLRNVCKINAQKFEQQAYEWWP